MLSIMLPWLAVAKSGVDPTRPLTGSSSANIASVKKTGALVLESIISRQKSRMAIINGTLLKQGDSIGKYQVKKLAKNSVLLTSIDGELELLLFPEEVAISK